MATQAFPYLIFTDGNLTATIADGSGGATNYGLEADTGAWNPAISGLSQGQLGGRGPYADVQETMRLNVSGATAAAAYANLQTLERIIDQAERWSRGENVPIVVAKFAPQGSTVASTALPLQAAIMGYAPGQQAACTTGNKILMMPSSSGSSFIIPGVVCRFMRRVWQLASAVTGTSAAVANPGPYPITGMTTHPYISPCQVKIAGFTTTTHFDLDDSAPIVLTAQQDSDLQIINPFDLVTPVAPFSGVVDSANKSRGGTVLRFTPPDTVEHSALSSAAFTGMTSSARRFAFYGAFRNNGASTFQVRLGLMVKVQTAAATYKIAAYTRLVTIDAAHTRPRFLPLGIATLPAALAGLIFLETGSAVSGSLDWDYLVIQAVDNPYARALQLTYNAGGTGIFDFSAAIDLLVDPLPLAALTPSVYRAKEGTSDTEPMGYYGDAFPVASGTTFTTAIMGKRGDQTSFWTYCAAGASPVSLTATASRQNAYPAPE